MFVATLVEAGKSTKLRLGNKVSALILKVVEGSPAVWLNSIAFNIPTITARPNMTAAKKPSQQQTAQQQQTAALQPPPQPQPTSSQPSSTQLPTTKHTIIKLQASLFSPPNITKQSARWIRLPHPVSSASPPPTKTLTIKEIPTSSTSPTEAELTSAAEKPLGKSL